MLACKKKGEIPSCNKENDILRAAEREFLAKGFSGARTVSIAQAAGVTHAMLHYYFRTKEQLFERILDQKVQAMAQSVLASFGQPGLPLVERIRDGVECHFDAVAANPDLIRFVINEIFVYPERFQAMQQQMSLVIERLIADLQAEVDAAARRGEVEQFDVRTLLLDIVSLNIFPFIAFPIIEPIFGDQAANREQFFARRKQENVEVIMRRIKKQ